MKAWKGGDLSSQSSSFPISSSNQPPPNTQLPTNHDDWKKQEALRCLLRASHDDALQNNDLVDKLKKIIEKLHLSVVEFTGWLFKVCFRFVFFIKNLIEKRFLVLIKYKNCRHFVLIFIQI